MNQMCIPYISIVINHSIFMIKMEMLYLAGLKIGPNTLKNVQLFLQNKGINLSVGSATYIHECLKSEQKLFK